MTILLWMLEHLEEIFMVLGAMYLALAVFVISQKADDKLAEKREAERLALFRQRRYAYMVSLHSDDLYRWHCHR